MEFQSNGPNGMGVLKYCNMHENINKLKMQQILFYICTIGDDFFFILSKRMLSTVHVLCSMHHEPWAMKVTNYEIIRTILAARRKIKWTKRTERSARNRVEKHEILKIEIDVYGILLNRTDGTHNVIRALNNGFPCSMFASPNFMDLTDYYYMCMHWW